MSTKRKRARTVSAQIVPVQAATKAQRIDDYNAAVKAAELVDISLMSLDLNIASGYFSAKQPELDRTFDVDVLFPKGPPANDLRGAVFRWSTKISSRDGQALFTVNSEWLVLYGGLASVDEAVSKAFIDKVGRFASYPYFRALVSQLSWASAANIPIMPVLR